MIERIFYRDGLPAFYEITPTFQESALQQKWGKPFKLSRDTLEEAAARTAMSREDVIFSSVNHFAEDEGVERPKYSVRLMRSDETRRFVRTALWSHLYRTAIESIVDVVPGLQSIPSQTFNMMALQSAEERALA